MLLISIILSPGSFRIGGTFVKRVVLFGTNEHHNLPILIELSMVLAGVIFIYSRGEKLFIRNKVS